MATSVACAAPVDSHVSFLSHLGHLGLECLTKVLPFLAKEAQQAEPIVDLMFPLEGGIFNAVVNAVCLAEVAGAPAMAEAAGGGSVKFQAVWSSVGPLLVDLAERQGLVGPAAETTAKGYIQAIVQLLNGPVKVPVPPPTGTPAT